MHPRLDARDVPVVRQPRRLAFGRGPLPPGPSSSCAQARSTDELAALAAEGVQSLLLEGGPTLATAFLEAGLVDKLLVFVAPTLSGAGPRFLGELSLRRGRCSMLSRGPSVPTCCSRPTCTSRRGTRGSLTPCSPGSCARSDRSSPSTAVTRAFGSRSRRRRPRRSSRSAARSRSTASASRPSPSARAACASTPSPRRSRARRSEASRPVAASTSSRPCARAIRWAGTSSRATSTASARCGRSTPEGEGVRLIVEATDDTLRYCVEKGSITVEGVSLTIADARTTMRSRVALIPHTLAETTLGALVPGPSRQPRGRRPREVRRAPARAPSRPS